MLYYKEGECNLVIDHNTLKKKNPLIKPFWECEKYIQDCFCEGKEINWDLISSYYELPEWFIEEYSDKFDWQRLTRWQKFDENTLRIFQDRIVWDLLNPNEYDIDFLREMSDKFAFRFYQLKTILQNEFGEKETYDPLVISIRKQQWLKENKI